MTEKTEYLFSELNPKTVVLSGLIYPMTMMHYFWRALERRNDVELFVVGPFFDDWIPWNGGMFLPKKYVKRPHLALPRSSAGYHVDPEMIRGELPDRIDLWIECDAGWCFGKRPKAEQVVHIQTDPHVLKQAYRTIRDRFDKVFCMQNYYREDDEIWLPYAYDPEIHYPEDLEKVYDVCLIGLQYDKRVGVLNSLRNKYRINSGIGLIYDDYREAYNKSKVAFSWSSAWDLPARVWEGLAMSLPVVCNKLPDLDACGLVSGFHYFGFGNHEEAVDQIQWALTHPEVAKMVARNGYDAVFYNHNTWDDRINTIFEECEL